MTPSKLIGGIFLLALAGLCAWTGSAAVAALSAVLGMYSIYLGISTPSFACPDCGALIEAADDAGEFLACSGCGSYSERKAGTIVKVEAGRVAPYPAFSVELDVNAAEPTYQWPEACCVCGKPPANRQAVAATFSRRTANVGDPTPQSYAVEVGGIPHCAEHVMGATLDRVRGQVYLKFRSLAYRNAFRQLNAR